MKNPSNHNRTRAGLVAIAVLAAGLMAHTPAGAADRLEPVSLIKVDVQKVATGYRASKVIGSAVVNDAGDSIGTVDDMIVNGETTKAPYVIVSVGGFLGMGKHLVAVPYESLQMAKDKIVFPGATKEQLKLLPEFRYEG
jgi:sporulation protein YlmC with PRC-barrel domain